MHPIKKTIPAIALSVMTLFGTPVHGAESTAVYSLDQIKTKVFAQNLEYKRALQDIEIAEFTLEKAEDDKGLVMNSALETAKHKEYYIDSAETELAYAQWKLKEKAEELELKIKDDYYNLLITNTELALQQQHVARMNAELEDVRTKISLGLATLSTATTLQIAIDKENLTVQALKNDKSNLMNSLNLLMREDLTKPFLPASVDIPVGNYTGDLNTAIKTALAADGDLAYLDAEGDLLANEVAIYTDLNDDESYNRTIVTTKTAVNQKRFDYTDKEITRSYDIRIQYIDLLNLQANSEIQQFAIDNLALDLKIATERFKVGMVTQNSLDDIEADLAAAKLELEKRHLESYLAAEALKNDLK